MNVEEGAGLQLPLIAYKEWTRIEHNDIGLDKNRRIVGVGRKKRLRGQ